MVSTIGKELECWYDLQKKQKKTWALVYSLVEVVWGVAINVVGREESHGTFL